MPFTFDIRGVDGPISETQWEMVAEHGTGHVPSFDAFSGLRATYSGNKVTITAGTAGRRGVIVTASGTHEIDLVPQSGTQWHTIWILVDRSPEWVTGTGGSGASASVGVITDSTMKIYIDTATQIPIPICSVRSSGGVIANIYDARTFAANVVSYLHDYTWTLQPEHRPGTLWLDPVGQMFAYTMSSSGALTRRRVSSGPLWNWAGWVPGNTSLWGGSPGAEVVLAESDVFTPVGGTARLLVCCTLQALTPLNGHIVFKLKQIHQDGTPTVDWWHRSYTTVQGGIGSITHADVSFVVETSKACRWQFTGAHETSIGATVADVPGNRMHIRQLDYA